MHCMCCCANVVTPFNLFLIMIISTCTCSLKERDKTSFFVEVLCDTYKVWCLKIICYPLLPSQQTEKCKSLIQRHINYLLALFIHFYIIKQADILKNEWDLNSKFYLTFINSMAIELESSVLSYGNVWNINSSYKNDKPLLYV